MNNRMNVGTYYVGDLCYVFKDENWQTLLKETDYLRDFSRYEGKVWASSTKWGDGRYPDEEGNSYPVDSGTIGVVSIDLIDDMSKTSLGRVIDAEREFTCYTDKYHTIHIGPIAIKTDLSR